VCCCVKALVVLHKWIEKNKENATGNELERALQRINREDIVNQCMHNVEEVTSEEEKQQALAVLEGPTTTPTGCELVQPLSPPVFDIVCFCVCMMADHINLKRWRNTAVMVHHKITEDIW